MGLQTLQTTLLSETDSSLIIVIQRITLPLV